MVKVQVQTAMTIGARRFASTAESRIGMTKKSYWRRSMLSSPFCA